MDFFVAAEEFVESQKLSLSIWSLLRIAVLGQHGQFPLLGVVLALEAGLGSYFIAADPDFRFPLSSILVHAHGYSFPATE